MDRRWRGLLLGVSSCVLVAGALTGCKDDEARRQIAELKTQVDSLTVLVGKQHGYLDSLDKVMESWRRTWPRPPHGDDYQPPPKPPGGY